MMFERRLFILYFAVANAQIGDKCILKSTNLEGECKLDCPSAVEEAKRGIPITKCGFYALTTPILCCEIPIVPNTFGQPNENSFVQSVDNSYPRPQENSFVEANENTFLTSGDIVFPENNNRPETSTNHRISEQKCEEYSREVSKVVQATPLILPSYPINFTVEKCDYNSVPLIVGGQPASPGEFPFMAAIGFNTDDEKWRCGGTLISEWFILTAAHCTDTLDLGPPTVVRLGHLILSSNNPLQQDYRIARIFNHPEYKPPLKYNDIALIRTQTKISFTNFTRPACLYTKLTINRKTALATGWGKTDYASENSDKLMKVSLNIYSNHFCQERYKNNTTLPKGVVASMICAGEIKGGKDTCQGDSGGPLLITKESNQCKFYVVGITSFGKSCGQVNTPAIYTKVSDYVEWIETIVWNT